jgi:hypothetical protein
MPSPTRMGTLTSKGPEICEHSQSRFDANILHEQCMPLVSPSMLTRIALESPSIVSRNNHELIYRNVTAIGKSGTPLGVMLIGDCRPPVRSLTRPET